MKQFIGCDAHKKYSVFVAMNALGERLQSFTEDGEQKFCESLWLPPLDSNRRVRPPRKGTERGKLDLTIGH